MNQKPFKPAWWLRNSHLQTIWPVVLRKRKLNPAIQLTRERIELPDGDFLDVDWANKHDAGPIVIVLHGFEGSIQSHYAKGMLNTLHAHGWRSVFMHFRGCSGVHNRLQRGYHSGDTSDLAHLVQVLQQREPQTEIAAVGYSLGGNILLKWLGETGAMNPLKAAIAISVPYDLRKVESRMQIGFSRFYQWYFMRCLRKRLRLKYSFMEAPIDMTGVDTAVSIRDFDDCFTAPVYGFRDAEEYYEATSSRHYLRFIRVPTLLLHAKDDPFMTEDVVPAHHELSASVKMELCDTGGHVGFVAGHLPWRPRYWLEERTPQFFSEYL